MPDLALAVYVLTLIFCPGGPMTAGQMCEDGTAPTQHNLSILKKEGKDEALFEFDVNGVSKFVLRPDGSTSAAPGFHVDQAALAFWQAVAATYKEACPDLATVVEGIKR